MKVLYINKNKLYRKSHKKLDLFTAIPNLTQCFGKNNHRRFFTNPTLGIKVLHTLHVQGMSFHCLILYTRSSSEPLYFTSFGIKFQIIGPKYRSDLEPL